MRYLDPKADLPNADRSYEEILEDELNKALVEDFEVKWEALMSGKTYYNDEELIKFKETMREEYAWRFKRGFERGWREGLQQALEQDKQEEEYA